MTFTIALGSLALALYFAFARRRGPKDPPHPKRLPLVGSLPYLREPIEEFLSDEFPDEPLVVVHLGLKKLYFINDIDALKEAFVNQGDKFLDRQDTTILKKLTGERGGIAMATGEQWREYRRFTLKTLRDLGFGRQGSEEIIRNEAQLLCETIDKSHGTALDTVPLLSTSISNVICMLVFGSRLASEDPKFERILEIFKTLTQSKFSQRFMLTMTLHMKMLAVIRPLLNVLFPSRRQPLNMFKELIDFCRQQADQHRKDMDGVSQARDYIEAHLKHQETHPQFNDVRLTLSISDLFIAGTDTTSHTTRWAILFMIDNPEVAERVFQEIDSKVGVERQVTTKDKAELHYTNAVIEEVHRLASLIPLGVLHRSTEEATVCGHVIPADCFVAMNIFHIHRSTRHFPEPEKFRPERFLDSNGHFRPSEHVVPFGVGKRACLGESLARMELLIFFATLMQRYRFSLDPTDTRSVAEIMKKAQVGGVVRAPAEHKIVFAARE